MRTSALAILFRDDKFNIALIGFVLSHGFDFIFNYLLSGKSKQKALDAVTLFFDSRIIVIHVSIVIGAFACNWFRGYNIGEHSAGAYATLTIFLIVKTLNDVFHAMTDARPIMVRSV